MLDDELIGGTVAWNQIFPQSTIALEKPDSRTHTSAFTIGDRITANHKYLFCVTFSNVANLGTRSVEVDVYTRVSGSNVVLTSLSATANGRGQTIFNASQSATSTGTTSATDGNIWAFSFISSSAPDGATATLSNFLLCDLTQMLGSTLADYIYGLGSTNGIAWLKSFGFFTAYCPYDSGSLLSVKTSAHETVKGGITHAYPLSDIELRGIPKLTDGNIVYDGDTYESSGTVTRKYGIVSFDGTESWSFSVGGGKGRVWRGVTGAKQSSSNIIGTYITADETQAAYPDVWKAWLNSNANPSLLIGVPSTITSASDWQTYLQSHPLTVVYELATPTTETTDPFENPQTAGSTEEYIDTRTVPMPVGHVTEYFNMEQMEKIQMHMGQAQAIKMHMPKGD